ncbi:MAG: hypothetical protein H3C35_07730 [Bacteroidetes bacterium]|nr:hypothetical protein [Bacteroidota bacterium]
MPEAVASKKLSWKWIVVGIVVGVFLTVSLYLAMGKTFSTGTVPTYMSLLGFIVMGIIIGYKSAGYTLTEPAIGGIFTAMLAGFFLSNVMEIEFSPTDKIVAPVLGLILGFIGGWVGEELQVTPEEKAKELAEEAAGKKLQWGWIAAGTILAFILNAFFVFGGFALLKFGLGGIFMSLGASFLLAGLLTAYYSPGRTIWEAALAGVFSMILNFVFLYIGFDRTILPIGYIIGMMIGGFVLSLLGGYFGEKLQSYMEDRIDP